MSIRVMAFVWEHSHHKNSDLLLLLAIADHADDEGIAYPAVPRLARKTRMTDRNVQYALKRLTQSSELAIHKNAGPRRTHLYQIKIDGAKFSPFNTRNIRASQEDGAKFSGVKSFQGEAAFTHDGEAGFTQTIIGTVREDKSKNSHKNESFPGAGNGVSPPGRPRTAKQVAPLSDEDWPGLRGLLTAFNLPLPQLDDNDWWNDLSYTCNAPTLQWLEREFARMEAWLKENPKKRPTTRWKTFIRGWLERSYERERKNYASQKR